MRYACDTYEQGNPLIDDDEQETPILQAKPNPHSKPCTYEIDEELEDPYP